VLLTVKEVAILHGKTERAIRKNIEIGKILANNQFCSTGQGGKTYKIPFDSLSSEIQAKYWAQQAEKLKNEERKEERKYMSDLKQMHGNNWDKFYNKAQQKLECVIAFNSDDKEKLKELLIKNSYSIRSVYRWCQEYKKQGITGLIRGVRSDKGSIKELCNDALNFIQALYIQPIRPSVPKIYEVYLMEAKKRDWNIVSLDTIYRIINRIPKDISIMGRDGKEAYRANALPKATRNLNSLKANEIWCGDGHVLAVLVPDGKRLKRYTFSAWLDMGSRAIVGYCIGTFSSATIIGRAFYNSVFPKENSPIFGLPSKVYMDNGKDYRSKKLNAGTSSNTFDFTLEQKGLFMELGVETIFAMPYTPWAKPIERSFRTFSDKFISNIIGSCGESIDRKPADLNKEIVLQNGISLEQLRDIIEESIQKYNNTKHSGLNGKTPLQAYLSKEKVRNDMPEEEEIDILLMEFVSRKITPSGIKMNHTYYWHEALAHKLDKTAHIRYDPEVLDKLWVWVDGEFLCIAETKELLSMSRNNEKVKEWIAYQRRTQKEVKEYIDSLGMSPAEARALFISVTISNEELVNIASGKNIKSYNTSNIVRINPATKEGKRIKKLKEAEKQKTEIQEESSFLIDYYKKKFEL